MNAAPDLLKAKLPLYVSAAADDAGLSVHAFRVLGRICRRWSEERGCYESAANMAAGCRMKRNTVFRALNELEERGMIRRTERPGQSTRLDPVAPAEWVPVSPNGTGTRSEPGPVSPSGPGPQTAQVPVSPNGTPPVSPNGTQRDTKNPSSEGIPTPTVPKGTGDDGEPVEVVAVERTDATPYAEIIDHLNDLIGTRYRATGKKTQALIRARIAEGATVEDFHTVHRKKAREWMGTERAQYLRPETLYGTKFEGYLNAPEPTRTRPSADDARNRPIETFRRNRAVVLAALGPQPGGVDHPGHA